MPQSNYQQHSCLLSLENGRWTMNGLRAMIGNEPAYRRWFQRYLFEKYG